MWVLAESIRGRVEIVNAALPDFDYRTGGAPLEGPRAERIGRSVHGAAPSVLDRSRNATSGPPGPQPTHLARARGLPPAIAIIRTAGSIPDQTTFLDHTRRYCFRYMSSITRVAGPGPRASVC